MALLAELVAVTVNLREERKDRIQQGARAEAGEIADLCGYDIAQHWTPDSAYLAVHTKKQLQALLTEMGIDDPRAAALKKDELVTFVAEAAAERRFAPRALAWLAAPSSPDPDGSDTFTAIPPASTVPSTMGLLPKSQAARSLPTGGRADSSAFVNRHRRLTPDRHPTLTPFGAGLQSPGGVARSHWRSAARSRRAHPRRGLIKLCLETASSRCRSRRCRSESEPVEQARWSSWRRRTPRATRRRPGWW